jgi:hypothetical protein
MQEVRFDGIEVDGRRQDPSQKSRPPAAQGTIVEEKSLGHDRIPIG